MKIITLTRADLLDEGIPAKDIDYFAFKEQSISFRDYMEADMVIFADKNNIKFLKIKYHQTKIVGDICPVPPILPILRRIFAKWQNAFTINP